MTDGRCLCGALRYQIDGPFVDMVHCHCSMCRKHHGAPFATWAVAPLSGFRWIGDTATLELVRKYFGCGQLANEAEEQACLAR